MRVDDPSANLVGTRPGQLALDARLVDKRVRDGQVTGIDLEIELSELTAGRIGSARVGLRFRSGSAYRELRSRNRDGAPLPSTATFRPSLKARPAAPATVGRHDARNVIVSEPIPVDGVVVADMLLPATHPSMFDHPQDHVPGMVLIEAARQAAVAGVADRHGFDPARIHVTALTSEFTKFAELEPTTRLIAMVGATNAADDTTVYNQAGVLSVEGVSSMPVAVELYQQGDVVCRVTAALSTVTPNLSQEG